MTSSIYITITQVTSRPGKADELAQSLRAIASLARTEEGCLTYLWYRSREGGTFCGLERWKSAAAREAHLQQPYHQAFYRDDFDRLVASRTPDLVMEAVTDEIFWKEGTHA